MKDSNLRTPKRTDLQSVAFNHSANYPFYLQLKNKKNWAEEGSRTRDLLITNQLLYQLSYFGLFKKELSIIFKASKYLFYLL